MRALATQISDILTLRETEPLNYLRVCHSETQELGLQDTNIYRPHSTLVYISLCHILINIQRENIDQH